MPNVAQALHASGERRCSLPCTASAAATRTRGRGWELRCVRAGAIAAGLAQQPLPLLLLKRRDELRRHVIFQLPGVLVAVLPPARPAPLVRSCLSGIQLAAVTTIAS